MRTAIGIGVGAGSMVLQVAVPLAAALGYPIPDTTQTLIAEAINGIAGLSALAFAYWSHRQTKKTVVNLEQANTSLQNLQLKGQSQ